MDNPVLDKNMNVINESLTDMGNSQNDLSHSVTLLAKEISSISANASCEEISIFNVTKDGYYMMRIQKDTTRRSHRKFSDVTEKY